MLICIVMKQKNDVIKEATNTIYFSIDEFLENHWNDIKNKRNETKDEYLKNIEDYITLVKESPKKTKTKEYKRTNKNEMKKARKRKIK